MSSSKCIIVPLNWRISSDYEKVTTTMEGDRIRRNIDDDAPHGTKNNYNFAYEILVSWAAIDRMDSKYLKYWQYYWPQKLQLFFNSICSFPPSLLTNLALRGKFAWAIANVSIGICRWQCTAQWYWHRRSLHNIVQHITVSIYAGSFLSRVKLRTNYWFSAFVSFSL